MKTDKIDQYILQADSGDLSVGRAKKLRQWIDASEENKAYYEQYMAVLDQARQMKVPEPGPNVMKSIMDEAGRQLRRQETQPLPFPSPLVWKYALAAAALVLVVFAVYNLRPPEIVPQVAVTPEAPVPDWDNGLDTKMDELEEDMQWLYAEWVSEENGSEDIFNDDVENMYNEIDTMEGIEI